MKLSNFTRGRDNNFNLIRIVAAFVVLIIHSFTVMKGAFDAAPFGESFRRTTGVIAVDIFFIMSGFLVTASLLNRQDIIEFIWARVLRIFPALLMMLFLTVFGLGIFFTSVPLFSYLTNAQTYIYLIKCTTLIFGAAYNLPGVFDENPYKNIVNVSLWTMPYEIRMYAILAIIWITLRIIKKIRLKIFELAIVIGTAVAGILLLARHFYFSAEDPFTRLFFMFFSGAAFYVLKKYITLSHSFFWLLVIALVLSVLINKHIFFVVYTLTIAYVLFYIAYIPAGYIRKYNMIGDYSYGVYIYAFPVQQSVAALVPGIPVVSMLMTSAFVTLLLAIFSWHFLEHRVLGLKGFYVGHTRKIFNDLTGASSQTR